MPAAISPITLELEPGSYWWCACGKSKNQPFCDGSHKDTDITPVKFEVTDKKTAAYCVCKKTGNRPFCDGSHNKP